MMSTMLKQQAMAPYKKNANSVLKGMMDRNPNSLDLCLSRLLRSRVINLPMLVMHHNQGAANDTRSKLP
jgi:hypothetical protein